MIFLSSHFFIITKLLNIIIQIILVMWISVSPSWECLRVTWKLADAQLAGPLPASVSVSLGWGLRVCVSSSFPRRWWDCCSGDRALISNDVKERALKTEWKIWVWLSMMLLNNHWLCVSYSTPLVLYFLLVENEGRNWPHRIRWDCILKPSF